MIHCLNCTGKPTDPWNIRLMPPRHLISARASENRIVKEESMPLLLIVILVLLLVGALPTWPYSSSWGYYPSGGLGLILLVLLVLLLMGRL